jgi:putative SOS response-associated peptidase YedK
MCGRFVFYSPSEAVVRLFGAEPYADIEPRYNLAPTQPVPVLRRGEDGQRRVGLLRWGLVPFWAKDPGVGNRMINARAETVASKPAFRQAFRRRRCLVLANGFYEWVRRGDAKQPHFITREDGEPFAMAGLWEQWRDPQDEAAAPLETCVIVTTTPNRLMAQLHDRMPVILDARAVQAWLAPDAADGTLEGLLVPYGGDDLVAVPVGRQVNNPRNQGSELIAPAGPALSA